MSFLSPKPAPVIQAPAVPTADDAATAAAAKKERDAYYQNFGGRGTAMLTGGGGTGLGANPGYGAAARLLGGG